MADSKLFVQIDQNLLQSAKETITVIFYDGENELAESEANLPPTVDLKNPYKLDLSPYLPNIVPLTLDRFFELTNNLIQDASNRSGIPVLPLVEEYPPLDMAKIGEEVITFRLISREPANLSSDGLSRPQRKARFSYFIKDPDIGDNVISVCTRPLDHEIEFTVWALQNKTANKKVLWLENLLVNNTWAYRSQGADRFYFKRRLSDGYLTTGSQRLFYRPLRFFLRFHEFQAFAGYPMKNIELAVSLSSGD